MIDTHAHLNNAKMYDKRAEFIENALKNNVNAIVNVGSDLETSKQVVEIANEFEQTFAVVGFHPHEAKKFNWFAKKQIKMLTKNNKVVAIGEIGLDFYYNFSLQEKQKAVFKKQLKLASKLNLPVVIHCRDATKQVLDILQKKKKLLKKGGIIHCFGEDIEVAKKYIELGFFLGIGGLITFKNSNLKNVIKQIGLEHIVLETDCPYLAPHPFRGKLNQPAYIKNICDYVADVLQVSSELVKEKTSFNAKRIYKL